MFQLFVLLLSDSFHSLQSLHGNLVDPDADDGGEDAACAFLQKHFGATFAMARQLFLVRRASVLVLYTVVCLFGVLSCYYCS